MAKWTVFGVVPGWHSGDQSGYTSPLATKEQAGEMATGRMCSGFFSREMRSQNNRKSKHRNGSRY